MKMALKSKFICKMKLRRFLSLLFVPFISCTSNQELISCKIYSFNTISYFYLYQENKAKFNDIKSIFDLYDELSDNYLPRGEENIFSINQKQGDVEIDEHLYDLLKKSFDVMNTATFYSPLIGSLAKKWKESLRNKEVLSESVILEELEKINNSHITFLDNNVINRVGTAELDLGGIVKGYVIDRTYEYLKDNNIKHYLINAGNSSLLVGEKKTNNGYYNIGFKDLPNKYIKMKNCFVSTSGVSTQGVKIDGVTYSHIINPYTGSAINNYDAVIVINDSGYLGDALSTSMMMNTLEEIKELEFSLSLQTIVIKDGNVLYHHPDLKIYNH